MSRFIDRAIWLIDNAPMFKGLLLHPSIRYCFLNHITKDDLRNINRNVPHIDNEYKEYIKKQPCLVCGKSSELCDPHHLRINNKGGIAKKPSDTMCVPLCHLHHLEYHKKGHEWFKEKTKWIKIGLDDFCFINYNRWKNHI